MDIAEDVRIGPFSFIREHTVIRSGTRIGDHAQIMGDCFIGIDCRFHSNVHISKGTTVGNRVFIAPGFVCTNVRYPRSKDTKTEGCIIMSDVKIGANVTLLPGVVIGEGALIGSGSVVTKNVPAHAIVVGNPARIIGDVRKLEAYQ